MTDETFHVHVPRTPPWAAGVPTTRDECLAEAQLLAVEYFGATEFAVTDIDARVRMDVLEMDVTFTAARQTPRTGPRTHADAERVPVEGSDAAEPAGGQE